MNPAGAWLKMRLLSFETSASERRNCSAGLKLSASLVWLNESAKTFVGREAVRFLSWSAAEYPLPKTDDEAGWVLSVG